MRIIALVIYFFITPFVATAQVGPDWCTHAEAQKLRGDINGDRQIDELCHTRNTGQKWVALRSGSQLNFAWENSSLRWCSHAGAILLLGDVNGDGRGDLVCKDPSRIWVDYESNFYGGTDFYVDTPWCSQRGASLLLADQNNDNRADLACIGGEGTFWVDYADTQGRFSGTGAGWRSPDFKIRGISPSGRGIRVSVTNSGASGILTKITCSSSSAAITREQNTQMNANTAYGFEVGWARAGSVYCRVTGKGIDDRPELVTSNNSFSGIPSF